MNRKKSIIDKTLGKRIILFLLVAIIITLVATTPTITYAKNVLQFVASVSIQPYYKIHAQGNTLYLKTNMTLYVNNKKVPYD